MGFHNTPMRSACGTASFNISSSLAERSVSSIVRPVMFPPGRGRLATCPTPIGSAWNENTMGIVWVACRVTSVEDGAKITLIFLRTSSAASPGNSSTVSAHMVKIYSYPKRRFLDFRSPD